MIGSFHLNEHAIARLEAGLRAQEVHQLQESSLALSAATQTPPVRGPPLVDEDVCDRGEPFVDTGPAPSSKLERTPAALAMHTFSNVRLTMILLLVAGAIAAPLVYFAVKISPSKMDSAVVPQPAIDEPLVAFLPLPRAVPPSPETSGASQPELLLDIKPIESEIQARSPQTGGSWSAR